MQPKENLSLLMGPNVSSLYNYAFFIKNYQVV